MRITDKLRDKKTLRVSLPVRSLGIQSFAAATTRPVTTATRRPRSRPSYDVGDSLSRPHRLSEKRTRTPGTVIAMSGQEVARAPAQPARGCPHAHVHAHAHMYMLCMCMYMHMSCYMHIHMTCCHVMSCAHAHVHVHVHVHVHAHVTSTSASTKCIWLLTELSGSTVASRSRVRHPIDPSPSLG